MLSTDDAPACANGSDEMTKDVGGQRAMAATNRWCAAGIRWPEAEAAEMGIMWKWEQCGCDRSIFLFCNLFRGFISM